MTAAPAPRRPTTAELLHLRRPRADFLHELREQQARETPSYREVGATLGTPPRDPLRRPDRGPEASGPGASGTLPRGSAHLSGSAPAGAGPEAFERAREALRAWAGHRALGMALSPERPELAVGTTLAFAVRLPAAPLWVTGACRVVAAIDEPDRFGFAYGTLPHHPEVGEELFLARRLPSGEVRLEITAVSRPSTRLLALAGPLGRLLQRRAARIYLAGLSAFPGA